MTHSVSTAHLVVIVATLFVASIALPTSAYTGGTQKYGDHIGNYSDFQSNGNSNKESYSFPAGGFGPNAVRELNSDSRPYSIPKIQACVKTHVTDVEEKASSSPNLLSKARGDALLNCIKSARVENNNSGSVAELLKKIEALRAQILKLKGQVSDMEEDEDEDEDDE